MPNKQFATLVELLEHRTRNQPDRQAYIFLRDGETKEVSLTYQELGQQAQAIAALLQEVVEPGARVLLLYPPGLDYIAAFFACLYAGVIAVPAYPPRRRRHDPRLQGILNDAQATVALTTQDILSGIDASFVHTADLKKLRQTEKVAHRRTDFYLSFFGNFESPASGQEIRSFRRMTNKSGVRLFPCGV